MRNKALFSGILFTLFFLVTACQKAKNEHDWLGVWEYRQANSAEPSAYDKEGELLQLNRENDTLVAKYQGISREGEHGLFYYSVKVKDLKLQNDELSFVIPKRKLYRSREAVGNENEQAGMTSDKLFLKGTLDSDVLVLECQSKHNSCPEKTLKFYKGKWSQPE